MALSVSTSLNVGNRGAAWDGGLFQVKAVVMNDETTIAALKSKPHEKLVEWDLRARYMHNGMKTSFLTYGTCRV